MDIYVSPEQYEYYRDRDLNKLSVLERQRILEEFNLTLAQSSGADPFNFIVLDHATAPVVPSHEEDDRKVLYLRQSELDLIYDLFRRELESLGYEVSTPYSMYSIITEKMRERFLETAELETDAAFYAVKQYPMGCYPMFEGWQKHPESIPDMILSRVSADNPLEVWISQFTYEILYEEDESAKIKGYLGIADTLYTYVQTKIEL